jgi:hypothetical protein
MLMSKEEQGARKANTRSRVMNAIGWVLVVGLVVFVVVLFVSENQRRTLSLQKAKESTLKANLLRLRSAIAFFQAETGVYPKSLEDIVAPATDGTLAGTTTVKAKNYTGPYLTAKGGIDGKDLPMNPFIAATDTDVTHHWTYTPATGAVQSAVAGTTMDGQAYTAL